MILQYYPVIFQYPSSTGDRVSVLEDILCLRYLWKYPGFFTAAMFCTWQTGQLMRNTQKGAMIFASCDRFNVFLTCNLPKCAIIFSCCAFVNNINILCTSEFFERILRASRNTLYQNQVLYGELERSMLWT